jgi:hypothetical protein
MCLDGFQPPLGVGGRTGLLSKVCGFYKCGIWPFCDLVEDM